MAISRQEMLKRLHAQVAAGKPIVGCGAGTGISAKMAEAGGADLIIIYNSGRYRMAGRGSLAGLMAYGDANAIVVEMAAEVLPVVKNTPVLAGVNGTDPFRLMPVFLKQLKEIGFSGVQNFPTVGLIDGNFRANLEGTGMGYDKEIEMIAAGPRAGPVHLALCLRRRPGQSHGQGRRGPAGGAHGPDHRRVDRRGGGADPGRSHRAGHGDRRGRAQRAQGYPGDRHGGPFDEPDNVGKALARMPGMQGFFGASSIERLPTERAIRGQVEAFKALKVA